MTTAGNQMLITSHLVECNHSGGGHIADAREPYKTITAKHTGGIVAANLIQYHTEQTENVRANGLEKPINTVDASNRYGFVSANLVEYYTSGTVMVRKDTGMWAPAAAADVAETKMLCVIDEAVDTTQNAKVAEDARAYRAGRLIYGKVTLAAGAALTAANMIVLRKQGLVFDRMEETGTFDNEKKG